MYLRLPRSSFGVILALALLAAAPLSRPAAALQQQVVPLSDADTRETRAQQLLVRGMTQAYLGNHDDALKLYEEALQLVPANAALLSAAAESLQALDDLPSATFYAARARDADPDNLYLYHQLAQLFLEAGEAPRAAETYESLLARFPGNVDALYALARVHTVHGRTDDAIAVYRRLLDAVGDDPDVLHELLQLYTQIDDEGGIERTLTALIDRQPGNTTLHRLLSELYIRQQRLGDAAATLETALAERPDDVDTVVALAGLYRRQGDEARADALIAASMARSGVTAEQLVAQASPFFARAADDPEAAETAARLLERAIEVTPAHAEALVLLGELRYLGGHYGEASDLLYRAVQANPRDPEVWARAAAAAHEAGDPTRALDVADEGLLLFPGHLPLLRLAGTAALDARRPRDARAHFEEALALLDEDGGADPLLRSELLGALAQAHGHEAEYARADSLYRLALAADPSSPAVLRSYALSLADRGARLDEALRLARRATDLDAGLESYDAIGWVHFKMGKLREAERWIGRALEGPAAAGVYDHYGDVMAALGRLDEARRYWQEALDRTPGDDALLRKLSND